MIRFRAFGYSFVIRKTPQPYKLDLSEETYMPTTSWGPPEKLTRVRSGGSRTEPRCEHQWRTPEIPPRGPQRCLWCSAEREA